MSNPDDAERAAREWVESIFVNGQGDIAERLVLTIDGRDLGGWCREALSDRLASLLLFREQAAREEWKREAKDWERGVKEFGRPMDPDHDHREVRDWLNDAFYAGRKNAVREKDARAAAFEEAARLCGNHFAVDVDARERLQADIRALEKGV